MTLARIGRLLLVVALLAAQGAAVSHQIWHAGASAAQSGAGQPDKAPGKDLLCDFHAALGTVLGALGGEQQLVQPAPLGAIAFVIAHSTPRSSAPFSPSSRDPPPLS